MTNALGFLPQCDKIIVLDEGRITEAGSYGELIDRDGAFAHFLRTYTGLDENEEGDPGKSEVDDTASQHKTHSLSLVLLSLHFPLHIPPPPNFTHFFLPLYPLLLCLAASSAHL